MNFENKLKELKPYDLNCNVFDVYNYNGLSMQELLCQFFTTINQCIKVSNDTIDLVSWLVNEGLEKEVVNKLMLWYEDGTLEGLINVTLFENLNKKIDVAFNYKNASDFNILGDGSDETNKIQELINSLSEYQILVFDSNKVYKVTSTLNINKDNVSIKGGIFHIEGNKSCFLVKGKNVVISDLEIRGNNTSFGNGIYGIEVQGNNTTIKNCYFNNLTYTGIMLSSSFNKVENCKGYNLGWDLVSNTPVGDKLVEFNYITNCYADKCLRHGFSCDPNTNNIYFTNCTARNIGGANLDEGHSCFHYEYSDNGVIKNCSVVYDNGHDYVNNNINNGGNVIIRGEGSSFEVDGLNIVVEGGYIPKSNNKIGFISLDDFNNTKVSNVKVNNIHLKSYNNDILLSSYIGKNNKLDINNSFIEGSLSIEQGSYSGFISNINNSIFKNKNNTLDFYYPKFYSETNVKNSTFEGFNNVFTGRFVNSNFNNNTFNNNKSCIKLLNEHDNDNSKSQNNIINSNTFIDNNSILTCGYYNGTQNNIVTNNIFKGVCNEVFYGTYSSVYWINNIKCSSFVCNGDIVNSTASLDLDDNLKSNFEISELKEDIIFNTGLHTAYHKYFDNSIFKQGNQVTIHFAFSSNTTVSNDTIITTLDEKFRPKNQVFFSIMKDNINNGYGIIKPNGDVVISSVVDNISMFASVTYSIL